MNFTALGLDQKPLMIVIFRLQTKDEVVGKDFVKEFGLSHSSMAFPESLIYKISAQIYDMIDTPTYEYLDFMEVIFAPIDLVTNPFSL